MLEDILARLPLVRAGVIGDFCLDAYWEIDNVRSETSVETGLATHPVRVQRYSLGGAGNVASNLRAMGVGTVSVYGVTGRDPFGYQTRELMRQAGIRSSGLLDQADHWTTHAYVKPIEDGAETGRIDFGNFNRLSDAVARDLVERLAEDCRDLDVVIVNQQVRDGIHRSDLFQEELQSLVGTHPGKSFVLDSRDMSGRYSGTMRKINACEAMRMLGADVEPHDLISLDDARAAAGKLAKDWGKPVFLTRGDRGCLVADGEQVSVVPGLHIVAQTDPVGAGDSMVAGIAAALAAGALPVDAATFGNFVAGVTVQKLRQTGTASPDEIRAIGRHPDYIYLPERADDSRTAVCWRKTEIEVVTEAPSGASPIRHAVFDHDGTISVLREGWEKIMEPMMMRSILGPAYDSADETSYHKVLNRVRTYIDNTTGVQTLAQMQGLVRLVTESGFVPATEILDESGYKAIYNATLLGLVRQRLDKFKSGELSVDDFTIKGAVDFLRRLRDAGVTLYLASGSDENDVIAEANALGYAGLFEERIYGAVGDVTKEAKKMVMDRILADIGEDRVKSMAAFGDGPVEIRESRKRGGLAVGVASDEVRRFGLNSAKRRRLIRAGADLIVPDFSQADRLMSLLGIGG